MDYPPPNQFLHTLFAKSNALLSHCGPSTAIVILAPVSSSLSMIDADTGLVFDDNLTDEFVQSHILRVAHVKGEVVERAKARVYTTINGKTLVIKEDAVFPHRGFKGVKEVKILHDSLFWPDDPNASPYLVYFLDRPLMGNALPLPLALASHQSNLRRTISSWAELIKAYPIVGTSMDPIYAKLFADFNQALQEEEAHSNHVHASGASHRSRNGSVSRRKRRPSASSSIFPAPVSRTNTSHSFDTSISLQYLRVRFDLVLTSAIQAFQTLPQTLLHNIGTESLLTGAEIEKLLESHILHELYDIIFFTVIGVTQEKDEELAQAIEHCKYVDLTQLGTTSTWDLRKRHSKALESFRGFGERHEPLHKIKALMSTMDVLMKDSEKSSDDLIPSLVSVVLKSGVSNLYANILWIREFAFEDVDSGEYGFALSTLEAVIYHITSSVQTLEITSARNLQFFTAITDSDLSAVRKMIASSPDLLNIRNLQDRTPHQVADPQILTYLLEQPCDVSNLTDLLMTHLSSSLVKNILALILSLDVAARLLLINQADDTGQSLAHKIHEHPELLYDVCDDVDWQLKDNQGNTPLQVLARIYDHPLYEELLEEVLRTISLGPDFGADTASEVFYNMADEARTEFREQSVHDSEHSLLEDGENDDDTDDSSDSEDDDEDDTDYTAPTSIRRPIRLQDHVDSRGNTLAHVVSTQRAMATVFRYCTGNFNSLNDKGLTPLLISIKFARSSTLEFLLSRAEIDNFKRDSRGHSAAHYAARASLSLFNICVREGIDVGDRAIGSGITPLHIASREGNLPILKRLIELNVEEAWDWRGFRAGDIVKNDAVRSIMDDWSCRDCEVRVLRGHVGEDCTVKYLVKSKSGGGVLRSLADFVKLRHWMVARHPALGIASLHVTTPPPCLLHSRPSRSVLMAVTERLDAFVESLLEEEAIKQSPIVWEFLLSPTIDEKAITAKIQGEIERERAQIWNDEKALSSYTSTQTFFLHAREQVMQLSSTYRIFERKSRALKDGQLHLSVAYGLISKALGPTSIFDPCYITAIEELSETLLSREPSLLYRLIEDSSSLDTRISGLLSSLLIPDACITRISRASAEISKHEKDLVKTPRISFPLLQDSQSRKKEIIKEQLRALHVELNHAGSELRHNEAQLAGNLSNFYTVHEAKVRRVIGQFVKKQVGVEKERLAGMQRALAGLRSSERP